MLTDPIADMLTRIRNAVRIEKYDVTMPHSKLKKAIADVLVREGYVWQAEEVEGTPFSSLRLELKYGTNGERVIQHIQRISKPGRRVYRKAKELKPVLRGMGISIVSTPMGVMSDRQAREQNLGGELLCQLW